MIVRTKLQNAKLPKMIGDLLHSNQFLKMFSFYTLTLLLISTIALIFIAMKDPTVLAFRPDGSILEVTTLPKAENQISEAIKAYLHRRYVWGPDDVNKKLKQSEAFILSHTMKAFQEDISKVANFSTEKAVTQVVYPDHIVVNLQKGIAAVTGNRITSIQGLKAAGDLKLELSFESGPRTVENPWGVYITKEKEE